MDFKDFSTASRFKDVVRAFVQEFLELERPRQTLAIVHTVDLDNRRVLVTFPSASEVTYDPVPFELAHLAPVEPGQTVIIDGPPSGRRVVAVLGHAQLIQRDRPICRAYAHSNQSVTSAAGWVKMTLSETTIDTHGLFSNSNDRIAIPSDSWASGPWLVGGQVKWLAAAGGSVRSQRIYMNGDTTVAQADLANGGQANTATITTLVDAGPGDYFELNASTDSNATVNGVESYSKVLWAVYMGAV